MTTIVLVFTFPILFILWSVSAGLEGYSFVKNAIDLRVINQSTIYSCKPQNAKWSQCTNSKCSFSFDYPATWNYVDLRPEGIGFSPAQEDLVRNLVISMGSPKSWDMEEEALKFAKGFIVPNRQETKINGLFATKDFDTLTGDGLASTVTIVDGLMSYEFMTVPDTLKDANISLTKDELLLIFEHMADSFRKETSESR